MGALQALFVPRDLRSAFGETLAPALTIAHAGCIVVSLRLVIVSMIFSPESESRARGHARGQILCFDIRSSRLTFESKRHDPPSPIGAPSRHPLPQRKDETQNPKSR
jgi:hypothetical protein